MPSLRLNIGLNGGRKLPFGGGAAPSGIPISTTNIIVNGGNAQSPNLTLSRTDASISTCNYGGDAYTFNAKWEGYMPTSGDWYMSSGGDGYVALGIATRKAIGGSEQLFIYFDNCTSVATQVVSPTWALFNYNGDEYGPAGSTFATNPSQDFNNVPTTGWVIYRDLTSITITAA
jgi:hypothetical protein